MSDRVVVVYERVSTDQQDISRQAVQRERAIADHPHAEMVVLQDDGVSAYKVPIFDRPGGRALCELVATGNVEAVYADAQDRLSRGRLAEWVNFKALCDDNGTQIVINGRALRADDEADEMLAAFEAMRARRESAEKSHRVRSGKARAASQGRPNGGPRRYGFEKQSDGVLSPRRDEIAVVERILREAIAGRSQTEIAVGLNADGHRTARGKAWNQPQISQLISDPIWIGVLRNGKGDHRVYDPFVPCELWEAAQKTLRGPDGPRAGRRTQRFLLGNGLLRCGRCGAAMIVRRDRKDYGWYEVYLCGGRTSGATDCTQAAVQRAAVDSAVLAYFERVGLDVEATRAELGDRANRERAELHALRTQAERELAKVQAGMEKVERDYTLGDLPAAEYTRLRTRLESELSASTGALDRLAAREREVEDLSVLEDVELLARLAELRSAIASDVTANPDDFAATHAAIRRLFKAFHLQDVRGLQLRGRFDAVVSVDGEEIILDGIPTVGDAEHAYVLEPVPRSDAVVLSGAGRVLPVPLGLRAEAAASAEGGISASSR
jgi:site-specific DNA recombinase